jgi:hypothetical protein
MAKPYIEEHDGKFYIYRGTRDELASGKIKRRSLVSVSSDREGAERHLAQLTKPKLKLFR